MSFWSKKFGSASDYELEKLVDNRVFADGIFETPAIHVICDIDKTYLETNFESIARIAKIAFEGPKDKITVHGATEVLNAVRWGADRDENGLRLPRELHFVSSSPPQLRGVLEEKLMLDGMDWSSDTFKNQAYNIRKRKLNLLRHHVGYKSLAILKIVFSAPSGSTFYMIGDNAETDTYIYLGVKCLLERRLSPAGYLRYLEFSGVEKSSLKALSSILTDVPKSQVAQIFIRNVEGYSLLEAPPLTDAIFQFDDFFEVGMELVWKKIIPSTNLWQLVRAFHNRHGFKVADLLGVLRAYSDQMETDGDSTAVCKQNVKETIGKLSSVLGSRPETPWELKATKNIWSVDGGPDEEEILKNAEPWIKSVLGSHASE